MKSRRTSQTSEHLLLVLGLGLVLWLPIAAWWGFVTSRLWTWFVVPLGVTHISTWTAAGICLLARLLTFDTTLQRTEDNGSGGGS